MKAFDTVNRIGSSRPLRRATNTVLSLHSEDLVVRAMKRTGLSDLGIESIGEPLEILCRALQDDRAAMHPFGRYAARTQLIGLLATRAKVIQLTAAHPEIEASPVERPIVIMGMPRTGTTFLQRLLSRDVGLRHLPYWEALAPMPEGSPLDRDAPTARRVRAAQRSIEFVDRVAPAMRTIHELDAHEADEEIWLLAVHMSSMIFECTWNVPAFAEWYDGADLREGYGWLRRMMQVLGWYRSGEQWLLKSPQHLERIPDLVATFPGVVLVQTHRDPVSVVTSTASMITTGRPVSSDRVDPDQIGRYWTWRLDRMLDRNMAQRDQLGDELGTPVIDLRFHELMADPMAAVDHIYATAGRELGDDARAAMVRYLDQRPRHHFGAHRYQPEDYGIDRVKVREQFAAYCERFGVQADATDA